MADLKYPGKRRQCKEFTNRIKRQKLDSENTDFFSPNMCSTKYNQKDLQGNQPLTEFAAEIFGAKSEEKMYFVHLFQENKLLSYKMQYRHVSSLLMPQLMQLP